MRQTLANGRLGGADEPGKPIGGWAPGRTPGAPPSVGGLRSGASPLWTPHRPDPSPALAPWLWPVEFNYVPVGKRRAAVGLLASLEAHTFVPANPTLVVRRAGLRTEHSAGAERVDERMEQGLLWLVTFELPLEVLQGPRAWFTLRALGRLPVPLPSPLLDPRVLDVVDPFGDQALDRRARRYLVAIGAGVAVATASATGATAAAANPAPVVAAAPSSPGSTSTPSASAPAKKATSKTKSPPATPRPQAGRDKGKGTAKPPTHPATPTPAHPPAHGHKKQSTSLGVALKITRPDSADICQRILLLPPAERKAALKRAWHTGARKCEPIAQPNATKKHKHHQNASHHKQEAAHGNQPAENVNPPAPAAHTQPSAAQVRKPAAHGHHPSGGAGLPAPRAVKPHVVIPSAPQSSPVVATPPAAVSSPQAATIWDGGFNIDPFSASQLEHFSKLVAKLDQPPRFLIPVYEAAGRRFHVPWQILAAINAIETNYGRNLAVSPAGAIGWMQFMPGTWREFGMTANGNHRPNPYDPRDAIFSAARYLATNGGARHIRRALFAYNHARWYVDAVLWRAQLINDHGLGKHARRSGYALPLDARYMRHLGRTDDGLDVEDAPDGVAAYSITPGIVTAVASDPAGFGPDYPVILVTKGPLAGQYIYYGHVAASLVDVGQHVVAGQPIAIMGHTGDAASLGHGHIEIGFSDASGDPLNHHGTVAWTPSGDAMRHVLWGYPGRLGSGTDDMYRGGETSVRRTAVTSLCCVLLVLSLGVAAAQARLRAPGLQAPGNGATVQSLPAFAWASLKSAGHYDFEFAADPKFSSGIKGFGQGAVRLDDTAITSQKAVPDGTYYWRVRGVTTKDHAGPWSSTRVLRKAWTSAPTLLNPMTGITAWPTNPLVLSWSSVPHAVKYDVWIATDPALSNLVFGSVKSPTWTEATNAALTTALTPGTYYWAVTPVDAEGNLGRRSQIASFSWSWPSDTSTSFANTSTDPGVFDPKLSWAPIPGATSYQVEVNSAQSFPAGSKLCCNDRILGTSLSPMQLLPNEQTVYWRVRAIDTRGDAGDWNYGQPFQESFDQLDPTVPNLTLRDANGNALVPGSSTQTPIVNWTAVPGAASYEIQIAPYSGGLCNWAALVQDVTTATTAWTNLKGAGHIGPSGWPSPEGGRSLTPGGTYCFQIRARRGDSAVGGGPVFSDSTQLGGPGNAAFTFTAPPNGNPGLMPQSAYIAPGDGTTVARTPLFTWSPVPNAGGYYVVVARDRFFTDVIDIGFTNTTAYAPRITGRSPYVDETTAYYWAVMPTNSTGSFLSDNNPEDDAPQSFNKSSVPPNLIAPGDGTTVSGIPTFQWSSAAGARNYHLQVAADPSFATPLIDVTTDSKSYTSETTPPADEILYWRVRANDVNGAGLNWSATESFSHTVPGPAPAPGNPIGGETLPVFSWTPENGAVGYDIHFVQADGTTKDFTTNGPLLSWEYWYGTGIWRWQVRANYPGGVSSAYFAPQMQFVRVETPPAGAYGSKSGNRIVISWNSDPNAKQYRVQLSITDGFGSTVASQTTDNTVWVPQIKATTARQTLYWRLATIDWGGNVGAYATGVFNAARPRKKPRACKRSKHHRCARPPHHKKRKK